MKFKFNLKLTAFLVGLFLSLLLVILGSKNKYCLSFGFMLMGVSLILFVPYNKEKMQKAVEEVSKEIDEIESVYDNLGNDDWDETDEEERAYILKQLYIRQNKLKKSQKKAIILFNLCGFALVVLGFVGLF